MKLVYADNAVIVLTALVYTERRLIEPHLTSACLSALVLAAHIYTVLVYTAWHLHENREHAQRINGVYLLNNSHSLYQLNYN